MSLSVQRNCPVSAGARPRKMSSGTQDSRGSRGCRAPRRRRARPGSTRAGTPPMPRESEAHAKRKSSSVRTSAFCRRDGTSAAKAAVSVARMRCTSFSSWMSSRAASSRSAETEAGSTNSVDPLAEASTTVPGRSRRRSRFSGRTRRPPRSVTYPSMNQSGCARSRDSSLPRIRSCAAARWRRRACSAGLARSSTSLPRRQRSTSCSRSGRGARERP